MSDIGFENDSLNTLIFKNLLKSKNYFEVQFHIENYKEKQCVIDTLGMSCSISKFCPFTHKGEKIKEDILFFKSFYSKFCTEQSELILEDIQKLFNMIKSNVNLLKNPNTNLKETLPEKKITKTKKLKSENKSKLFNETLENSISIKLSNSKKDEFLKVNEYIKKNIYEEIKNIPTLIRGHPFYNLINTDNQVVFISNSNPKKDELNKLLIAFLNSHDGIIIYGADLNSNKLTGIKLDRKARDCFKQNFNAEYKDYLVEYEGCIKYKFYDLEDKSNDKEKLEDMCIIVIKVKKIKENKLLFNVLNKSFVIKPKYLNKFTDNSSEIIKLLDIKHLNMKEYIEITREKLLKYYKNNTK